MLAPLIRVGSRLDGWRDCALRISLADGLFPNLYSSFAQSISLLRSKFFMKITSQFVYPEDLGLATHFRHSFNLLWG